MGINLSLRKRMYITIVAVIVLLFSSYYLFTARDNGQIAGFVSGNGRVEATEIDIAAKLAGRIEKIFVEEGTFVKEGQLLATMQTDTLKAQLAQARAEVDKAKAEAISLEAQISLRKSDHQAAEAIVMQRISELDAIERRLRSSTVLSKKGAMSKREFDDDETGVRAAKATLDSAKAQVAVALAAIDVARAQANGGLASVKAAEATVVRYEADINDCRLLAPRDGRIQYRIAEPGEVLAAGGKVLNLIELSTVYMTFFLPEEAAGQLTLGGEVRLILDAAQQYPIPAKISYVASTAQFTPKTVETYSERQKLMFRVKAQIDRDLLLQYITQVKTGLPGVAWVRLDPQAAWPDFLTVNMPEPSK